MSKIAYWYCPHCKEELSPSRVTYQELCDTCGHLVEWIEDIDIDRLRELVEADMDGRCVVLPCKVGEYWARDGKQYIVAEISVTSAWGIMVRHYEKGNGKMLSCNPQYFAKHYTRAEAEEALKEAQHE
jgi:hypothetical protein